MNKQIKNLKAVLLDFDGTVVNSLASLYDIYDNFLKKQGYEGTKTEFEELNGPALSEIIPILIKRYSLTESVEELLPVYQALLQQYYQEIAQPFAGALEFIKTVKQTHRKLLLVTSAPEQLVYPFLKRLNLTACFDALITSEGLKKSKPHPAIYQLALQQAKVEPREALAIEDSEKGVQAATTAGIITWRVDPFSSLNWTLLKQSPLDATFKAMNWEMIQHLFIRDYV